MLFFLVCIALVSGATLAIRMSGFTVVTVPKAGGTYIEAIVGTPSLINPLFALANAPDLDLTRLIYTGLVRKDTNGNIIPDLAERFTVSPDQKTYTIRLKTNAAWHDGAPVTADDVLFTIERIQNPEMKSPLAQSFRGVDVKKIDDATIQLTLKEAFAPFIETLTTGILPEHLWRDVPMATAQLADYNIKPVGSGPFRFSSLVKDKKGVVKSYTLERFTRYHGTPPYLKELTFKFYATFTDAVEALKKSEVQGIHFIPKQFKEKIPSGNYHVINLSFPQYTTIFFNQENNKALKEKRVRQALIAAIDRERMIQDVLGGEATRITSPILPGTFSTLSRSAPALFDPEKAKKLLTDAGWKTITKEEYQKKLDRERALAEEQREKELKNQENSAKNGSASGGKTTPDLREVERDAKPTETKKETTAPNAERLLDHYREKNGAILSVRLTTIDHPENIAVAAMIQSAWESIGVAVTLMLQSDNFQKEILSPRAYEALLFGVIVGRDPDPYPFWHSSQREAPGLNLALFVNREADVLLEDARRTNDLGIRESKYQRFQEILIEELPADFLYTPTYTYLLGNIVNGFAIQSIARSDDRFANVHEWYVKTKWALKKNN